MKVLCVTHSSRPFLEARCTINALEQRFPPGRLQNLPPLESLPGVEQAVPYGGALTLWQVLEGGHGPRLRFLRQYRPDYKVQFATFYGPRLLVYGSDRLEVLDQEMQVVQTFRDPWLVGGHTVHVDPQGLVWLTCAPANAVLGVDLERETVVERLPMPARYGRGYRLRPEDDLHRHYVPTDLQPTHVNSAVPWREGLLVTLWIPGVVGYFDSRRRYREILSGFRGCHSGRVTPDTEELYFTDSPTGVVWFADPNSGRLLGRMSTGSRWLHDAESLGGGWFACTLGDRNELWLMNRQGGEVSQQIKCDRFGRSVMFVHCCQVDDSWARLKERLPFSHTPEKGMPPLKKGLELLRPLHAADFWESVNEQHIRLGLVLGCESEKTYEYLLMSPHFVLKPGRYLLRARIACHMGGFSVGLLDVVSDRWLAQLIFDEVNHSSWEELRLECRTKCRVVVAAYNPEQARAVEGRIEQISLIHLSE